MAQKTLFIHLPAQRASGTAPKRIWEWVQAPPGLWMGFVPQTRATAEDSSSGVSLSASHLFLLSALHATLSFTKEHIPFRRTV